MTKDEWKEDWQAEFLQHVSNGVAVSEICSSDGFPSTSRVYQQLNSDKDFAVSYAMAKEVFSDQVFSETRSIADDVEESHEAVAKAKLRIDQRKWAAGKLAPKKYGDRMAVNLNDDAPKLMTEEEQKEAIKRIVPQIAPLLVELGWKPPKEVTDG